MKLYCVFISSKVLDTRQPRAAVISGLLSAQYMPLGVEFPHATLEDTRAHLRTQIAHSDFVCIIIKARYGDLVPGMQVSWTEYEYEIACELKKPVIACVYRNRGPAKTHVDPQTTRFIQRLEADNKHLLFWSSDTQLSTAVLASLKALTQANPTGGWVRRVDWDEEESLESFYRRSADYDFSRFILHEGDIRVLLTDGYSWRRRNESALRARFQSLGRFSTTIITCDNRGAYLGYIARKSEKKPREQRNDITELHQRLRELARKTHYTRLTLLKSDRVNTHCLYLCDDYVLVTTYFTSDHRFLHLPLLKFHSNTGIYNDYSLDFNLIARPLLDQKR